MTGHAGDGATPAVECEGVTRRFGGLEAVSQVSLSLAAGERRAIIGPNGAGKTTLFRLISGEMPVTAGRMRLFGRDITTTPCHRRTQLGLGRTFQITNLFPTLSVLDNLVLAALGLGRTKFSMLRPLWTYPEPRARALETLDTVGLADRRDGIVRTQLVPSRVLFDKPVGRLTADGALPVGYVYMRNVGPPSKVIDVAEQQVLIAGARANKITGTINGIETATLQFFDIRNVTLSTGAAADRITLPHGNGGLAAQGLVNFTLNTGGGSDTLLLNGSELNPPASVEQFVANGSSYTRLVGAFTFDGGTGDDSIVTASDDSWRLNPDSLQSFGGDRLALVGVEAATLTGLAGGNVYNYFLVGGWNGALRLDGGGGADGYQVQVGPQDHFEIADSGANPAEQDFLVLVGSAAAEALVVNPNDLSVGTGTANYTGIETLVVAGGAGDDYLRVRNTSANTLQLIGQDGSDTYDVGFDSLRVGVAVFVNDSSASVGDSLLKRAGDVIVGTGAPFEMSNPAYPGRKVTFDESIEWLVGSSAAAPPELNIAATQGAIEGRSTDFVLGSFSHPGHVGPSWVGTVDWGDGLAQESFSTVPGTLAARAHTYAQDGVYTVTVGVHENGFISAGTARTFLVTVANAVPVLTPVAAQAATEGTPFSVALAAQDGADDHLRWSLTSAPAGASIDQNGVFRWTPPAGPLTQGVMVRVTDDAGGFAETAFNIVVANAAPLLSNLAATAVDEGGVTWFSGTVSDAGRGDVLTVDINWGDPQSPGNLQRIVLAPFVFFGQVLFDRPQTFSLSHRYLDGVPSLNRAIVATVTDSDGGTSSKVAVVTVANVAPVLSALQVTASTEDGFAVLSGQIVDPGLRDDFTLDIDWGDPSSPGNLQRVVVAHDGAGVQNFGLLHRYLDNPASGFYLVKATVTDKDGGVGIRYALANVSNTAPGLGNLQATGIDENGATVFTGTVTDDGTRDSFTLDIDWGDPLSPGNHQQVTFAASATGTQEVRLTHRYQDNHQTTAPLLSSVDVASLAIADVNVALDITHTYDGDLQVILVSPTGTELQLFGGVGGGGGNFSGTVLDDEAGAPMGEGAAPFTGRYRPLNALAAFDGQSALGDWTLRITDQAGQDVGSLNGWSLEVGFTDGSVATYAAAGLPQAIPDFDGAGASLESRLTVGAPTVADVDVTLDITHPRDHDLQAFLRSPSGTEIALFSVVGGTGANFSNTTLDDEAGGELFWGAAPFAGRYAPMQALSAADGEAAFGDWTLTLIDQNTGQAGMLNGWSLQLTLADGSVRTITSAAGPAAIPDHGASYTIGVVVTDDDGARGSGAVGLTVANVAPVLSSLLATGTNENGDTVFTGTVTDPGARDSYTLDIDWGDPLSPGNLQQVTLAPSATGSQTFTLTHRYLDSSPVSAPLSSVLVVPSIYALTVTLDIAHTWDADLSAYLVSPTGTTVQLFGGVGGPGDNFSGTELADQAASSIAFGSAPFIGSFRPLESLSAFSGQSVLGDWTLRLIDQAGQDVGTLNGWSLGVLFSDFSYSAYSATNGPQAIPDAGLGQLESRLTVASPTIVDLDLALDITHTHDGDLQIVLVSPAGTEVPLSNRLGGSGANFTGTVFDDEAASAIAGASAPFAGRLRPVGALSALDGEAAFGDWTLRITDQGGADAGMLDGWSLTFTLSDGSVRTTTSTARAVAIPDHGAVFTIGATVTDSDGASGSAAMAVAVADVAPVLTVSGPSQAVTGQAYVITLGSTDPGNDPLRQWSIDWGDGRVDTVGATAATASHVYTAVGAFTVRATASNDDGDFDATPLGVQVLAGTLQLTNFTATDSGFTARFSQVLNSAKLNLYDTATAGLGAADVVLTGPAGVVPGSLVLDADRQGFSFVRTGTALAAGNYTVTLASRSNGFTDLAGVLLDGDANGVAGGDHVRAFSVAGSGALLSIVDIARGPGQALSQPATLAGLPIRLSNAAGASRVEFTLDFDATLLSVTGVTLGTGASAGSTISTDASQAGRLRVVVNLGTPVVGTGVVELVRLLSNVPLGAAALYAQKQVLDLTVVSINNGAIAARADDGVHVNAYVGDANANRGYNTLDVQRLQRVVARFDTGFAAYPLLDPAILGDTSGNGSFNSLDVSRLQQRVVGIAQTTIPAFPTPALATQVFGGADPVVSMGAVVSAAGALVTVPILLDEIATLESVQLGLTYPQDLLRLIAVREVGVTADFQFRADQSGPGWVTFDVSRLDAVAGSGPARLFELDFLVAADAPAGDIPIDLQWAVLNDTGLTLNPAPLPGPDVTDGRITIVAPGNAHAIEPVPAAGGLPGLSTSAGRDLPTILFTAPTTIKPLAIEQRDWKRSFVTNLGAPASANPNAALRLTLPVTAKAVSTLGRLAR